jgi:hypothetical protein
LSLTFAYSITLPGFKKSSFRSSPPFQGKKILLLLCRSAATALPLKMFLQTGITLGMASWKNALKNKRPWKSQARKP